VCVRCGRAAKPGRFSCNDCGGTIVERSTSASAAAQASPSSTQWGPTERWTPEPTAPVATAAPVAAPPEPSPPPAWAAVVAQPEPSQPSAAWAAPAPAYWAPPVGTGQPPRKNPARKIVLSIVAGIVVLFVGLVLAVAFLGRTGPPSALDNYMHGKGTTYSFPGDTASVRMSDARAHVARRKRDRGDARRCGAQDLRDVVLQVRG
jgi:hypothetical protein